jgi:arylesterase / paraoxonase
MKKKIVIIICVAAIVGVAVVLKIFYSAGEFKKLVPQSNCTCTRVKNITGPEDIAIDDSTGIAFISSLDWRAYIKGKPHQGSIFAYNLEGKPVLKNMTAGLKIKFYPHGISFYKDRNGKKYLFVVNHRPPRHYVEIFEYRNKALVHRETIGGDLMISPNDVAAVGPRQFYFTNDHGSRYGFLRRLEDFLQLSWSNIAYYDGRDIRIAAKNLSYANGIWAGSDGKMLYVTATTGKKFYAYNRSGDGSLKQLLQIDLGSGGDNINIDSNGRILIASHPKMITFLKHAGNKANRAPAQILEVYKNKKGEYSFREIYLNSGNEISAASVAAGYKNRLLIGAIFENFFLDCIIQK